MRVAILGIDGYLGWSLALYLANRGYAVCGLDDLSRRIRVAEMSSGSAIPISSPSAREISFRDRWGAFSLERISVTDSDSFYDFMNRNRPDVVVHLAEIPSAPYSMLGRSKAVQVMENNVIGTLNVLYAMHKFCPHAHLVKLGTMGEYGTPDVDIPEGFFQVDYRGRSDTLPFPRQAGSWYHWTKVHDSNNIMFACDLWGLKSTDIMQGVVYGAHLPEMETTLNMNTRFDIDEAFGTVINRFVAQALLGHPLTVYGDTGGQTRGFLPLQDSMQCIHRIIENPPDPGEYRVINQFEDTYSIIELARKVKEVGERDAGLDNITIQHYRNPRVEAHDHYYNPDHEKLQEMGYEPTENMDAVLLSMMSKLGKHYSDLERYRRALVPKIDWLDGMVGLMEIIE